jgi:hypothetical protein
MQFSIFFFAHRLISYSVCGVTRSVLCRPTAARFLSLMTRNAIIFCSSHLHAKLNTAAVHKSTTGQLKTRFASRLSSDLRIRIKSLSENC